MRISDKTWLRQPRDTLELSNSHAGSRGMTERGLSGCGRPSGGGIISERKAGLAAPERRGELLGSVWRKAERTNVSSVQASVPLLCRGSPQAAVAGNPAPTMPARKADRLRAIAAKLNDLRQIRSGDRWNPMTVCTGLTYVA
jgi:hypothetical protein